MKKGQNLTGLTNVFKALENEELSEDQLDKELSKLNISSEQLVKTALERIKKIKAAGSKGHVDLRTQSEEFNPFLIAAKKTPKKGEKLARKLKKRS